MRTIAKGKRGIEVSLFLQRKTNSRLFAKKKEITSLDQATCFFCGCVKNQQSRIKQSCLLKTHGWNKVTVYIRNIQFCEVMKIFLNAKNVVIQRLYTIVKAFVHHYCIESDLSLRQLLSPDRPSLIIRIELENFILLVVKPFPADDEERISKLNDLTKNQVMG